MRPSVWVSHFISVLQNFVALEVSAYRPCNVRIVYNCNMGVAVRTCKAGATGVRPLGNTELLIGSDAQENRPSSLFGFKSKVLYIQRSSISERALFLEGSVKINM